jgi:ABC-type branched-subunit amino acid transport system substrate-binding protein
MKQRFARSGSVLVAVVALTFGVTVPFASAQGSDEKPEATEIGVTAKEIRIAILADVDTPVAPGLFKGSQDAVEGFAKYINKQGGLADRKVVVDFIDTKLSADEARNAIIKACQEDFAMVGTAALFINNIDDQTACVDQAGAVTGLPDIPFLATEVQQQCSPITFPVSPPQVLCDTVDEHPQTYQASVGRGFYYKKKFGNDLHGVYIFGSDLRSARNASFSSGLGQVRQICCESDRDFDLSARAPQSEYTPVVQEIKDQSSSYAQSAGPFNTTVALRKEAKLQGIDSVKVWDCGTQCYDPALIEQGGADVEGQFADTLYLPFFNAADRKANKMAAAFFKNVGADNAGQLGAPYSWIAAIAFRDAVNAVVEEHGVNGLTRANLLDALGNIDDFDADGFYSGVDLAGREIGPCHVLNQVKNGKFVRIQPTKPGKFDCPKGGVVHTELDLIQS